MIRHKFFIVILLHSIIQLTISFKTTSFYDREPGDALIHIQTKVTVPTEKIELHRLEFYWSGANQRFTQVELEMNDYDSASMYRTDRSSLTAYVYHKNIKQLIVTLLVYGFNETLKYDDVKNDSATRLTVNNNND